MQCQCLVWPKTGRPQCLSSTFRSWHLADHGAGDSTLDCASARLLLPVEIAVIEICLAGQLDILSGGDWNRWRVYIGTDCGFVIGTGGGFAVEYAVFYVRPAWAQSWR